MAKNSLIQRTVAEGIGTFCLVFAGCGALMVSERFAGSVAPGSVPIVFGLAVAIMIYGVGHISGAHFNPAVTLGFAMAGKFPKKEIGAYWLAQFSAAIAAVALLYALLPPSGFYGATVSKVPVFQALIWEAVLTFFLMFVISAVATDTRAHGALAGLAIGATVCLDAFVGGPITGASMNPARSLAPAIFQGELASLWIYFVGPAAGAVAGALAYERLK